MNPDILLIFCTCPDKASARTIASQLVADKLAACCNILPGVESVFAWQGKAEIAQEHLLLIKTTAAAFAKLEEKILELHPYECPEIIASTISQGNMQYLDWVASSCEYRKKL